MIDRERVWDFLEYIAIAAMFGLVIGLAITSWLFISGGSPRYGNAISSMAVAIVTTFYVLLTWRLAKSTERTITQREKFREEEKNHLRRAIRAEVLQNRNQLQSLNPKDTKSGRTSFFYSEVYQGNTDKIGALTDHEVWRIVESSL